jgi:hypothetical protein
MTSIGRLCSIIDYNRRLSDSFVKEIGPLILDQVVHTITEQIIIRVRNKFRQDFEAALLRIRMNLHREWLLSLNY